MWSLAFEGDKCPPDTLQTMSLRPERYHEAQQKLVNLVGNESTESTQSFCGCGRVRSS